MAGDVALRECHDFFGVYLLYCSNPKYLGQTYIGYTVDPVRRIKQHNKGCQAGGARRTSNRGPWQMVLIIHGFPNDISALRFEWAWQHPKLSRRLKHVTGKAAREKQLDYRIRVACEMMQVGPWKMLPLTVRWLLPEFARDFPVGLSPPVHMPIAYGPAPTRRKTRKTKKKGEPTSQEVPEMIECTLCSEVVDLKRVLRCYHCPLEAHAICLAKSISKRLLPIEGNCPRCKKNLLWGEVIAKSRSCL